MRKLRRVAVLLVITSIAASLSGCGDHGGSEGGAPIGTPILLTITAEPGGAAIWNWNGGAPIVPVLPPTVSLNASIVFTFDGAVSAGPSAVFLTSLTPGGIGAPPPGPLPVAGSFTIENSADLPAGNRRRLVFRPTFGALLGSASCNAGGFPPSSTVFIDVLAGSVDVAGALLANQAQAPFSSSPCGVGAYVDIAAGPPFVVGASIPLNEPAGSPVSPASIQDDRILMTIGELLDPSTTSGSVLIVRDLQSGATVPGFSTPLAPVPGEQPPRTRLAFFASDPFPAGRTLEVVVSDTARDYGGNAVQSSLQNSPGVDGVFGTPDDGPQKKLLFATVAVPLVLRSVGESFDDVLRLASTAGFVTWNGGGDVVFGTAASTFGDGSDGAFVAPPGVINLDTDGTIVVGGVPQSRRGVWNFTGLTVPAGSTLRLHGPYPAELRVLGDAVIDGTIQADAGIVDPAAPGAAPAFELGPRSGVGNNGSGFSPTTVAGGRGNAGGGDGGRASHSDLATAPADYCPSTVVGPHTYFGEAGTGPFVDGSPVTDPISPLFSGGGGGRSGVLPTSWGDPGGFGGAGGTAATNGEDGIPRIAAACAPATVPNCPIPFQGNLVPLNLATARPVTVAFIPPISFLTGGAGGGGGGDKLQTTFNAPANDDQGGGGGGGGGAFRIATIGGLTLGSTAILSANGATGGAGAAAQFAGNGGSGSGGQLWLTSIGPMIIPVTAQFSVIGPPRWNGGTPAGCTTQAAGGGGQGLVQLDYPAGQGAPSLVPSLGAVLQLVPIVGTGTIQGEATTSFFDLAAFAPDYVSATVAFDPGSTPSATITVAFEGAHALPDGSGPDPATLKTTDGGLGITAANITALDGYRFVRVRMTGTIPLPPGVAPPVVGLPRVESVTITYRTP